MTLARHSGHFGRLVAGLEEAGYAVVRWHGPGAVELDGRAARRRPARLEVRVRLLRPGGHGSGESSMRVWLPRPASRRVGIARLSLGYEPGLDVYVGWPDHDAGAASAQGRLWVARRTLVEAAERGFAPPPPNSFAFAFRADQVAEYLAVHRRQVVRRSTGRPSESDAYRVRSSAKAIGLRKRSPRSARTQVPRMVMAPLLSIPSVTPKSREIESGFSLARRPDMPLAADRPLKAGQRYLYWFGIGADFGSSIEATPVPPPKNLPDRALLTVKLFPFEGELELVGKTRGELKLLPDGRALVTRPATIGSERPRFGKRLLFFAVRTRRRKGIQRLRCNLYHGSTLLQSRLVSCRVGAGKLTDKPGLLSELDYSLAADVDIDTLAQVPCHDLSLLVNGGGLAGERTHQFRFFRGDDQDFDADASLEEEKIARGVREIRKALRKASWNTEEEFVDGRDTYRYPKAPGDHARFSADLIRMARRGHDLYLDITGNLSDGKKSRRELEAATREPRRIQIARTKEGLYLPAALFYDHPLETAPGEEDEKKFRLCDAFLAALDDRSRPLEDSDCVMGKCPNRAETLVVCPSGFWGFRHEIGWPMSVAKPLTKVSLDGPAELAIGVSTDKKLKFRKEHVKRILAMGTGEVAESRDRFGALAKSTSPHLVYFYCHGGVTKSMGVPFLELGVRGSNGLNRAFLNAQEIVWEDPLRPVVFINGCRTTALEPETLSSLVGAFVEDAKAIGVIGTEVTVFESLACGFAESVLGKFLDGSMTIGGAMRRARFDLLRDRNPLGLVYVPFVAAETQLIPA